MTLSKIYPGISFASHFLLIYFISKITQKPEVLIWTQVVAGAD